MSKLILTASKPSPKDILTKVLSLSLSSRRSLRACHVVSSTSFTFKGNLFPFGMSKESTPSIATATTASGSLNGSVIEIPLHIPLYNNKNYNIQLKF